MQMTIEQHWETLKVDPSYEICIEYPYQIMRKDNGYIISEIELNSGYIQIKLSGKLYYKHVVIARQWIDNDDPNNKIEVDHRNRNRADYHIENLRWVTRSVNDLNRTGWGQYKYEYVDELPVDVTPIITYRGIEFEAYFMDSDGEVWFYNGEQYRRMRVNAENKVRLWDINHKLHNIGIIGLRREFQH
ncbi:hypothetical protein M9Y10_030174 [Tritrichomonas musculus]|uniref:HNH nuclease domain-containing protein n=1 Tax=Tritrichomonas musculus TaxID=1915356 RepID=A0ABR2KRA5_9EUKA